jgi:hypothetical protein
MDNYEENYEENYDKFYKHYNNLKNDYESIVENPLSLLPWENPDARFVRFYINGPIDYRNQPAANQRYNDLMDKYCCNDDNFKYHISVIKDDLEVLLDEVTNYFMLFRSKHNSKYGSLFSAINKKLNKNYNITRQNFTKLINLIKEQIEVIKLKCVEYITTDLEIKGGKSKKRKTNKRKTNKRKTNKRKTNKKR